MYGEDIIEYKKIFESIKGEDDYLHTAILHFFSSKSTRRYQYVILYCSVSRLLSIKRRALFNALSRSAIHFVNRPGFNGDEIKMKILQLLGRSPDNVIGSGRIELEEHEKSQRTAISLQQLEKAVRIAKDLKWNDIVIRIQNDFPLFLSEMVEDEDNQEVIGIFVCPIVATIKD